MKNITAFIALSTTALILLSACGGGSTTTDADAKSCVVLSFTNVTTNNAGGLTNNCPFDVNVVVYTESITFGPVTMGANSRTSFSGTDLDPRVIDEPVQFFGACRTPYVPNRISERGTICRNP
ncbi:MAG: hypothetical protein ACRBHB_22790 [Arenicella sp.]